MSEDKNLKLLTEWTPLSYTSQTIKESKEKGASESEWKMWMWLLRKN